MPTQTGTPTIKFYSQFDTAPDLVDTLLEVDGVTPIDLTNADVYITIAHVLGDPFNHVTDPQVDHGVVDVKDAVNGGVAWTPQINDLSVPGVFGYNYTIVFANSRQQTVKSFTYDHIRVQSPPGGRLAKQWTP